MSKSFVLVDENKYNAMTFQRPTGTIDVLKSEQDDLLYKKGIKKDAQNLLYNDALRNYLYQLKELHERPIPVTFKQSKAKEQFLPPPPMTPVTTSNTQSSMSNYSIPDVSFQETISTPKARYPKRDRKNKTEEKNKKQKKALALGDYLMRTSDKINENGEVLNSRGVAIGKSNVYKSTKKLMHLNTPSLPSPPGHSVVKKIIKEDPETKKFFKSPKLWT